MNGFYLQLQEIISNFLFNGVPESAIYGNFIIEAIPAVICTVLMVLPFIIVWRIIRRFL